MATGGLDRHAARSKLAELLREPLARVAEDTRLHKLGRYDPEVARRLLRVFGVHVTDEQVQAFERVRDLLDALRAAPQASRQVRVESAPRPPALPPRERAPEPAPVEPPDAGFASSPPPGTYESPSAYVEERIGAAAVYCSDGRMGDQMDEFLHQGLGLPRYDRVACPGGPVGLAARLLAFWECRGVEEQVRFLVRAHGLRSVVLIAHQGCAYYTARLGLAAHDVEDAQRRDLQQAAAAVGRMGSVDVRAFFARRAGGRIRFEPVELS